MAKEKKKPIKSFLIRIKLSVLTLFNIEIEVNINR